VALALGLSMTSTIDSTIGAFQADLGDNGNWGAGNRFAGIGDLSFESTSTLFNGSMTFNLRCTRTCFQPREYVSIQHCGSGVGDAPQVLVQFGTGHLDRQDAFFHLLNQILVGVGQTNKAIPRQGWAGRHAQCGDDVGRFLEHFYRNLRKVFGGPQGPSDVFRG
jgi:hypothetical protein